MATTPPYPRFRRIFLAGAVAVVTVSGAWYGAGLKTQQQRKQAITTVREASASERIAMLEARRAGLVTKRGGLERKVLELRGRRGVGDTEKAPKEVEGEGF